MAAPSMNAASSRKGAEGTVMVSALVVGMVYAYRKLIEGSTAPAAGSPLRKVVGLESQPAGIAQFTVAYGFTFFTLSIAAMAAPELAAAMAILIATGDVLTNGASVFNDISRQVAGATAGRPAPAPAATKPAAGATRAAATSEAAAAGRTASEAIGRVG